MLSVVLDAAVFVACFAFAYFAAGRYQVLALSTRALLVVLVALAIAFVLEDVGPEHEVLGAAAVTANLLFGAFVGIDIYRWRKQTRRQIPPT